MTTETIFMVLILLVIAVLLTVLVGMSIATKKQLDDVCDEVERLKESNEPEPFIKGIDSRRDKPKYLPLEFEKPITGEEIFQKHLQDFYNKEFKSEIMVDFNELEKTELDSIKNSVGFAMYRLNQSLDEFSKILKEEIKRLNSKKL